MENWQLTGSLLVAGLIVISMLVFMIPYLNRKGYGLSKNLLYGFFVVVWSIIFIYLVIRVGGMILFRFLS